MDDERVDLPVKVTVSVGGEILVTVLANRLRRDVLETHGSGRHGFDIYLPTLCSLKRHLVSVQIEGADVDLEGSPVLIEASDAFDEEAVSSIGRMMTAADETALPRIADALVDGLEAVLVRNASLSTQETLRHFAFSRFRHRGGGAAENPPAPRRRALLVKAAGGQDDLSGEDLVVASYAQSLIRLGFEVVIMASDAARRACAYDQTLTTQGVRFLSSPLSGSVEEVFRREGPSFGVILLFRLATAVRYAFMARSENPKARIVYVKTLAVDALPPGPSDSGFSETLDSFRRAEHFVVSLVDAVAVSKTAAPLESVNAKEMHVTWAAPVHVRPFHFEARHGLAVRGPAATRPDLVRWVEGTVLTRVREADASIDLVDTETESPRLILAPGMTAHVEVVEALASGIPCIASPNVLRDLGAPIGLHICEPADLDALAAAILLLHRDPLANRYVRHEGLDFIDDHHAPAVLDDAMGSLLRHGRKQRPTRSAVRKEMSA